MVKECPFGMENLHIVMINCREAFKEIEEKLSENKL